jgi:hypothetical protein
MEKELQVGRQKIRFDREGTVALYRDTITVSGADQCGCLSCKNFSAQRSKAYSEEFLHLLDDLGVNPLREWEAFDYDFETSPQNHLYGGWFLFSGELIEGIDERPNQEKLDFTYWFTTSFPTPTLGKSIKICAVEFSTQIPWVLPEKSG